MARSAQAVRWSAAVLLAILSVVAMPTGPAGAGVADTPWRLVLLGDSVPAFLVRDAAASGWTHFGVEVVNGARGSCDGMPNLPLLRARDLWNHTVYLSPPGDCRPWSETYLAPLLAGGRADAAVLMVGQPPILDAFVDRAWRGPCDGIGWYLDDVAHRVELLRAVGVPPVLALPAPPGPNSRFMYPDDYATRSACVRAEMARAAARWRVPVIDLTEVLCPDGRVDPCRTTAHDGIHVEARQAGPVLDAIVERTRTITFRDPRGRGEHRPRHPRSPRRGHGTSSTG
ncbi:MAG: hypothetical protein ACKO2C_05640 [Actinomycetes bacterium]